MADEKCKICEGKAAKYNCPRCNILYCSVDCYKSQQHLECSEGFFRENVLEELELRQTEGEAATSAKSMLAILQRMEQADPQEEGSLSDTSMTDSDDDERERALAARLGGIDLDDADSVWERLTSAEKEEFQSLVENGDIIKVLPKLNCWWTQNYKVDLIQQAGERSQEEQTLFSACPRVWDKIPSLKNIFSNKPSTAVRFNIVNTLAAYSFVYRYFHGDIQENAVEATDCLLSICLNLKKNVLFDSESMAVESVTSECINKQLPTNSMTTSVLKDHVHTFITGPKECGKKYKKLFLLAALSDMRRLFSRARREYREIHGRKESKQINKAIDKSVDINVTDLKHIESRLIQGCQKKMEFFLAYASSDFL